MTVLIKRNIPLPIPYVLVHTNLQFFQPFSIVKHIKCILSLGHITPFDVQNKNQKFFNSYLPTFCYFSLAVTTSIQIIVYIVWNCCFWIKLYSCFISLQLPDGYPSILFSSNKQLTSTESMLIHWQLDTARIQWTMAHKPISHRSK